MTTGQQPEKKKAGSIRQYATLGRVKPESSDVEALRSSDVQELKRSDAEIPRSSDVQELKRSDAEIPRSSDAQELKRSDASTTKRERHTIYFPPDLSQWIKIHAIKTKREISEIATEALERYRQEAEGK